MRNRSVRNQPPTRPLDDKLVFFFLSHTAIIVKSLLLYTVLNVGAAYRDEESRQKPADRLKVTHLALCL